MRRVPDRERGVALLTVLLLVAVMSALAVGVLDDIRFSLRRAANAQSVGQAQWYALGAETLAQARVRALLERDAGRVTLQGDWADRPFVFPIEGGTVAARLKDGGACFNLNAVVTGALVGQVGEGLVASPEGVRQLAALIRLTGASGDGERLAWAVADWIDQDNDTSPQGAEDEAYVRLRSPYRTAGALLAEVSELRAVRGFTPEVYARLRPYVCALPETGPARINVNTLPEDRAAVLAALWSGRLPVETARGVLASRPASGWASESAFLAQAALSPAGAPDDPTQLTLRSRFFALDAEVAYADAQVVMSALLQQDAGAIRTVARRWTPDE